MRKKPSHVMLIVLVLFLSLVIIQERNIGSAAEATTKVFVDPPETIDPSKVIGSTFTVKVNVSNVEELYGWQINMTYNPAVLNTTLASIVEGPFLKKNGNPTQLVAKKVDNALGNLLVAYMLKIPYPPNGVSGNGTLVSITFKVKALERATLLRLVTDGLFPTKLNRIIGNTPVPIEHTTEDGIFDNRVGNAPPVANFSPDPSVANISDTIKFDASASNDPDAWLVSYYWDFDDGTTQLFMREYLRDVNLTAKTTHSYSEVGTYTVNLTVTDNNGAKASTTSEVTVKAHDIAITNLRSSHIAVMPSVQVTLNVTAANKGDYTGSFNVTTYYDENPIEMKQVTDLAPHTETKLTFTWNTIGVAYGRYTLKANATIDEDETNTTNNEFVDGTITISTTNIVDYPVVVGGFTFHVLVESNSITSDQIQFSSLEKKINFTAQGEAGTDGVCNVTIPVNLLGGQYTIWLDASNITQNVQQTKNDTHAFLYFTYIQNTHNIEIVGQTVATPPVAIFTVSTTRTIAGTSITFNATDSYDPDDNYPLTCSWDFGDQSTATGETVEHTYSSHGKYNVTMTVKDTKQLASLAKTMITIIDYPQAAFTYSPSIPLVNQPIAFNALSSKPEGGEIVEYSWDFGDGTKAEGITYIHTYQEIGNYTVVLNVSDSEELWDIEKRIVTVSIHNIALKDLSVTPSTVQIGQQISISVRIVNEGNFTETPELSAYYNNTLIEKKSVSDLATRDAETITITWNTANANPATYELKTAASTVPGEMKTDDNTLIAIVTVTKKTSQLILGDLPETLTLGEETTISGTATPAYAGMSITIQQRLIDAPSWTTIGTTTTDSEGRFAYNWKPEEAGTYEIRAAWLGDSSTFPSESDPQQVTVKEPPPQLIVPYLVGAAIAIVLIAVVVYFLRIRKP